MLKRLFLCWLLLSTAQLGASTINLMVPIVPGHRDIYQQLIADFTRETGIQVSLKVKNSEDYKRDFPLLLQASPGFDVLLWNAGQRLFSFVDQGFLAPVTDVWQQQGLEKSMGHVSDNVSYGKHIYAIPRSYYPWGIYYRKSLLERFGGPPNNWQQFLAVCAALKLNGIIPIGIGRKFHWPVDAWFDYLNLRINGLDFHLQVTQGKIDFHHQKLQTVFQYWSDIISLGYFHPDAVNMSSFDLLPLLYRKKIGFFLMGSFDNGMLPKNSPTLIEDIGFMAFPKINDIGVFEEAPIDVYVIPMNAPHPVEAKKFLAFISSREAQKKYPQMFGQLPINREVVIKSSTLIEDGLSILANAEGVSQYFDRDAKVEFAKPANLLFNQFMTTNNVEQLTEQLEKLRKTIFGLSESSIKQY